jgi:hypothetical protein
LPGRGWGTAGGGRSSRGRQLTAEVRLRSWDGGLGTLAAGKTEGMRRQRVLCATTVRKRNGEEDDCGETRLQKKGRRGPATAGMMGG